MSSLLEIVRRFVPRTGPLASGTFRRIALGVAVVVLATPPLLVETPPAGLEEGKPAPRTFRANRQIQFEDTESTARLRTEAAQEVEPVMRVDADAPQAARVRLDAFYAAIATASRPATAVPGPRDADVPATTPVVSIEAIAQKHAVSEQVVRSALALDAKMRAEAARATAELVAGTMAGQVTEDDLSDVRTRLRQSAALLPIPVQARSVVAEVGVAVLRPTVVVDHAETIVAREKAAASVPAVVEVKQAGENVVVRGEIVTERHLSILASLGQIKGGSDPGTAGAVVGLLVLIVFAAGVYLYRYEQAVYGRMRELAVIAVLFLGMIGITRVVLWLLPEASPHMMPVPLSGMLGTLLISPTIGVLLALSTAAAAALLGLAGGVQVVPLLVSSLVAIVAMSSLTQRRHLFYAGLSVIGATAVAAGIASLAGGGSVVSAMSAAGYGGVGGSLSAVLAYGLLPFFEYVFGVTTDVRLLELSSPSAPLLRELMASAPGTYSHSVLAGSLAETAADAIGANPLLARVGAYYHDVGKISRPVFFAENLAGQENPHDDKTPWLSASIITAHVRDGVEIAKRHRLPREVIDIIRQHHGDSLIAYFYSKAAQGAHPVREADFRYSGERPKSPEAALVMLADSVEAAMRAIRSPSLPEVESAVRKVVREKVDDGQLNEAQLTLADIETIVRVYAKMLVSIYHPRVQYPTLPRRTEDAGQRYQSSGS